MPPRRKEKSFCLKCGKDIKLKQYKNCNGKYNKKYCSKKCYHKYSRGEKHPSWKGGEYLDSAGYKYVYSPNHPNKNKMGYVKESRLVVEKSLGRYLTKDEKVHHINRITSCNEISNLSVMSASEHNRLHCVEDGLSKYIARRKYNRFNSLPNNVIVDKIISIGKEYRTYIGKRCILCDKKFWSRKDHKSIVCSSRCRVKIAWMEGKFKNRKRRSTKECQNLK